MGSNTTHGGYVPWNSYVGVANTLNIVGVPGVIYNFQSTQSVNCTAAGRLYTSSFLDGLDVDIPGYMIVFTDFIGSPNPPFTTMCIVKLRTSSTI